MPLKSSFDLISEGKLKNDFNVTSEDIKRAISKLRIVARVQLLYKKN